MCLVAGLRWESQFRGKNNPKKISFSWESKFAGNSNAKVLTKTPQTTIFSELNSEPSRWFSDMKNLSAFSFCWAVMKPGSECCKMCFRSRSGRRTWGKRERATSNAKSSWCLTASQTLKTTINISGKASAAEVSFCFLAVAVSDLKARRH